MSVGPGMCMPQMCLGLWKMGDPHRGQGHLTNSLLYTPAACTAEQLVTCCLCILVFGAYAYIEEVLDLCNLSSRQILTCSQTEAC